jgi:enoyl-CoA hydratase/carnithine racemase
MLDMMLTGRVYKAAEAVPLGLAQYHVPEGQALAKALALAEQVAGNAPMTNYALIHGLPRIAEQPADHGFLTESMLAAIAQSAPEAKARVRAFLDGSGPKVQAQ